MKYDENPKGHVNIFLLIFEIHLSNGINNSFIIYIKFNQYQIYTNYYSLPLFDIPIIINSLVLEKLFTQYLLLNVRSSETLR